MFCSLLPLWCKHTHYGSSQGVSLMQLSMELGRGARYPTSGVSWWALRAVWTQASCSDSHSGRCHDL